MVTDPISEATEPLPIRANPFIKPLDGGLVLNILDKALGPPV
jgi:hypothetical protein